MKTLKTSYKDFIASALIYISIFVSILIFFALPLFKIANIIKWPWESFIFALIAILGTWICLILCMMVAYKLKIEDEMFRRATDKHTSTFEVKEE